MSKDHNKDIKADNSKRQNDSNFDEMKLANQLCFPLYAAARKVTGLYTPFLKELGLTYTQYIVMLVLWENDGVSISEIGEKLMLDNGTLSPLLKKMQQAGYIEKKRSEKDDRVVLISLTAEGKALQEKAKEVPVRVSGCIDLPPEKAHLLYTLLYELLGNQRRKGVSASRDTQQMQAAEQAQ